MMEYKKLNERISDPINENVKALEKIFPSAVKDGEVDFDALKEELGKFKKAGKEKYELTWAGKQNAKKKAQEPVMGRTLKYVPEESKDADTTQNLYIEGDNLEVLKLLRENYYGSIKMIYIDPPYNTGNDFIYNDDFKMSQEESDMEEGNIDDEGNRLIKNQKSSNKYHARWLNMMYPRLKVAKDLLTQDGVIFISIDDNEAADLRQICDEVFEEKNYVTTLHVQMSTVQGQKVKAAKQGDIVKNGEFILIYCKSGKKNICIKYLTDPVKYDNHYNKFLILLNDNNFKEINLVDKISEQTDIIEELKTLGIINSKNHKLSSNNLQMAYDISPKFKNWIDSNCNNICRIHDSIDIPNNVKPRLNKGEISFYKSENRSYLIGIDNNGKVSQRILLSEKINKANDFYNTFGPTTIRGDWWSGFYLDMGNVSKEGDVNYNNGKKPVRLIKQLIELVCNKGDVILDFFSGSATTAHAVMQLNAEDGGHRKFIMVQLPEPCDKKLEAYKAGYKDVCEIGKERIRKAGDKIKKELKEKMTGQQNMLQDEKSVDPDSLDIGFKVFKTGATNIRWMHEALKSGQIAIDENAMSNKDKLDFMPGFKDIDVVYEALLRQRDVPLSSRVEKLSSIGDRTYIFSESFVVCLEEKIDKEMIEKFAAIEPLPIKFIFRDSAFEDDIELKDESFRRLSALIERNTGEIGKAYTVEFI